MTGLIIILVLVIGCGGEVPLLMGTRRFAVAVTWLKEWPLSGFL